LHRHTGEEAEEHHDTEADEAAQACEQQAWNLAASEANKMDAHGRRDHAAE